MKKEITSKKWWLVDAENQTLGRLATHVASILRGKDKPEYVPNKDCGDFVIITNAEKVRLSGSKKSQKMYYSHTGYIGNMKKINAEDLLKTHPTRVIEHAVKGMLPKNKLQQCFMKKLKIYAGSQHPHEAQNPEVMKNFDFSPRLGKSIKEVESK